MGQTQSREAGHRPVRPIDFQGGLEASMTDDECEAFRRSLALSNKIAFDLSRAVDDAHYVGHQLRALMYMFRAALEGENKDLQFEASHLVIDIVETMTKRLDTISELAAVVYDPLRASLRAA